MYNLSSIKLIKIVFKMSRGKYFHYSCCQYMSLLIHHIGQQLRLTFGVFKWSRKLVSCTIVAVKHKCVAWKVFFVVVIVLQAFSVVKEYDLLDFYFNV